MNEVVGTRAHVTIGISATFMVAAMAWALLSLGQGDGLFRLPFAADPPAPTSLHVSSPGEGAAGTALDLTSFDAAASSLSSGDVRIDWPGADDLGDTAITGLSVRTNSTAKTIVFTGSVTLDTNPLSAMLILDWEAGPTPTISLGVKGDFAVSTLNADWDLEGGAFVIDGYAVIATGPQDISTVDTTDFYGDLTELTAGLEIEGGMNLASLFPDIGVDAATEIRLGASLDADIAALLTISDLEPADPGAVTFTASVSADELSIPSLPGLSASAFEVSLDLVGAGADQEFVIAATGSLTIDDPAIASAPVTFDVNFDTDGASTSLTGGVSEGSAWNDPFGATGVTVSSLKLGLDAPGGAVTPTLSLSGSASIGDINIEATIAANDELAVTLGMDPVTVNQIVSVFDALGLGDATLDNELGQLIIGPTALTLQTDSGQVNGALSTGMSFRGLDATMLLSGGTAPGTPVLAAVQLPAATVGDLAPSVPAAIGAIPLPGGGFIISDVAVAKADYEPGGIEDAYLSEMFCGTEVASADCDYDIPSGLSLAARVTIDETIREALQVLVPLSDEPLRIDGFIPIFEPGDVDLTVTLPALSPDPLIPEQKGTAEWLEEARLSITFTTSGTDFAVKLVGELDTLLPDETEPDGTDAVTFTVDAELNLGATDVSITIGASVGTWDTPFGVDWVDLNGFRLEIVITVAPTPGVQLGLAASATLTSPCAAFGGTGCPPPSTFEASFAIGVSVGTPVKVDFGLRIFADQITLRDVAAIAKEMGAAIDDPSSLPDASLRNVEFAFSTIDAPNLCLSRGLTIGADVYLDTPAGAADAPPEVDLGLCSETSITPAEGIASCAADAACFAHLRLEVSDEGITAAASIGTIDLSPVVVNGASVSLTLTESEQSFTVAGSVSIEGFVSVDGSLSISSTGFAFTLSTSDDNGNLVTIAGSAGLNPDEPGFAFQLRIFVRLPGLDEAIEDAQEVLSVLSEAFTGEPLGTTYKLRCIEVNVDLITGASDPISGEINARVHFSAIDTASGYEDGRVWQIGWDFDASVTTNVSGLATSLSGATSQDYTGCGYQPVLTTFSIDGSDPRPSGLLLEASLTPRTAAASWTAKDYGVYYVDYDLGSIGGRFSTVPQRYEPTDIITASHDVYLLNKEDESHDVVEATATIYMQSTDGWVALDAVSAPLTVAYSGVSEYTLTTTGAPAEGGLVTVTATWNNPLSTFTPNLTSGFKYWYTQSGAANPDGTATQVFPSPTAGSFPQATPHEHAVQIQLPDPCFCRLWVEHELTDGVYLYEYGHQDITVAFDRPTITGVSIDGNGTAPLVAGPTSKARITYNLPTAVGSASFNDPWTVVINDVRYQTTQVSPTEVDVTLVAFYDGGGSNELSFVLEPDFQFRGRSAPVTRNVIFIPENSNSVTPELMSVFGDRPQTVTASGTTLTPSTVDDNPNPFGSSDCGAIWYSTTTDNNLAATLSTAGSRTLVSRIDGDGQELAIAVYENGSLIAEIAPDGDRGTTVSPQELAFDMQAGADYLIAVAASDTAPGCPYEPDRTGPVRLTLRTGGVAPYQSSTLGFLAQYPSVSEFLFTEYVDLDNPSIDTDLDNAFQGTEFPVDTVPGLTDCFDDPFEQTVWYTLGAFPGGSGPVDLVVLAEHGDVQAAVFSSTDLVNISLVGCSEDGPATWIDGGKPPPPVVSFDVETGVFYIIMVDTNGRQSANITPFLTGRGSTAVSPIPIELGAPGQLHDNRLSSSALGVSSLPCSPSALVHNNWFVWTAETSEPVDIGSSLGASDIALAVFPVDEIGSLIEGNDAIACQDDPGSRPETLRLNPTAGKEYLILVASAATEANTSFDIDITTRADKSVNDVRIDVDQFPYRGIISNLGSTSDADNPDCSTFDNSVGVDSASVWYGFNLPDDIDIDIDTFGSSIDTTLVVSNIAQEIGCNDDAAGTLQSRVRTSGTAYDGGSFGFADQYVRIDGFGGAQGDIRLNLTTRGDDSRNAVDLGAGGNPSATLNNQYGTVEAGEQHGTCHYGSDALDRTVWWTWTAPVVGAVYEVAVTGFDAQLTIFDGKSGVPGDIVGCGEDEGPNLTPLTTFDAHGGQTYFFQVDGYGSVGGDATISLTQGVTLDPDNDSVEDPFDNCPATPNTDQINTDGADDGGDACDDDDDNDGVPDATDNCRIVVNPDQINTDNGGSGDACDNDDDNDGVPDATDNCRIVVNPDQINTDNGGSGDACDNDDDNDGVPDATDNCRIVVNADQADADGDGAGDVCDPTPNPPATDVFSSISPVRLVETRSGDKFQTIDDLFEGDGTIKANTVYEVDISGRGGIPDTARAAVLNLTTVAPQAAGFLTIYPCGDRPKASGINYTAGAVVNNEIIAKLSATGHLCIYASAETHLVIDAVGSAPSPSPYVAVTPARVVETRSGAKFQTVDDEFEGDGTIKTNTVYKVEIAGRGGIAPDAAAAVLNLTTVAPKAAGFLTVFPCGDQPKASGINYTAGAVVNNEIITKLSATGEICIFASAETHVVIDAAGYIPTGAAYTPITPARIVETRIGPKFQTVDDRYEGDGTIKTGTTYRVKIAGRGGVDPDATAATLNLTTVAPVAAGFLTIYPCGTQPKASGINYNAGAVVNNEIIAKLSPQGEICIYASAETHLVIDATGWL